MMKSCRATTVSQPTNLVLQMWENMFVWYRPAQMSYHPDFELFFSIVMLNNSSVWIFFFSRLKNENYGAKIITTNPESYRIGNILSKQSCSCADLPEICQEMTGGTDWEWHATKVPGKKWTFGNPQGTRAPNPLILNSENSCSVCFTVYRQYFVVSSELM